MLKASMTNDSFVELTGYVQKDSVELTGYLQKDSEIIVGKIDEHIAIPRYSGSNSVTPTIEMQKLETNGKVVTSDITVNPIPFYKTSNETGYTVIIG